jgi:hypothetical protein
VPRQRPPRSSATGPPASNWWEAHWPERPHAAVASEDAAVEGPVARHGLREAQLLDEVSEDLSAVLHGVHHCTLDGE